MGGGGRKRKRANDLSAIDWPPGCCLLSSMSGSQSVVPRTTSSALPGNLIEIAELLNLKLSGWEPAICVLTNLEGLWGQIKSESHGSRWTWKAVHHPSVSGGLRVLGDAVNLVHFLLLGQPRSGGRFSIQAANLKHFYGLVFLFFCLSYTNS